ncbi:MAG TPA: hypothetical protein PKV71_14370, partial [Calditrichia bacterium]|nr:hypothetical protein [Calditrichia bacterium]
YMNMALHQAVISGMNVAVNDVWANSTTSANFNIITDLCSTRVVISQPDPDTVEVRAKSWTTVFDPISGGNQLLEDSVFAAFAYNAPVSRYYSFMDSIPHLYYIGGDTIWGRVHSNTKIWTSGNPVFYGKVTARQAIIPNPGTPASSAEFLDGWEIGLDISLPTDLSYLINSAISDNGTAPINTVCMYDRVTTFEFLYTGSIIRTVGSDPPDTVALATIAPGGVIYSTADVRVKGVIDGRLTIYSTQNIWIDDDMVYRVDPSLDPTSDDMLGLIAGQSVMITDNVPNNSDVIIHGSILAIHGHFMAENYASRPIAGHLYRVGSTAQQVAGAMGTFNPAHGIQSGFITIGRYDNRLSTTSPPRFPFVRELSLASWWE